MKIISETPDHLIASDKSTAALVVGPIVLVLGLVVLILARNLLVGVLGLLLVAVGGFMIATRQTRTVTADKSLGKVSIQGRSLVHRQLGEYLFHDITKVQLVTGPAPIVNNGPEQAPGIALGTVIVGMGGVTLAPGPQTAHLMLVLNNGTMTEVASGEQKAQLKGLLGGALSADVGARIAAFIGRPFEGSGSAPVGDVVAEAVAAGNIAPAEAPAAGAAPVGASTGPAVVAAPTDANGAGAAATGPAPAPAPVPPAAAAPAPAAPAPTTPVTPATPASGVNTSETPSQPPASPQA